ncbi:RNA polymerase sigma-70 factor [Butyricimonas paravirosa]|uniref:RNA polymerase sigma-70 factor n=1 Tax=Butyricimonas paravirosa TaxID=1472417 RepID=UPI00210BA2D8|nr:RNA polymerase sigma-70 factor [Butyricimonas paravirosa]MCQ4873549.1 RNA polymerase sigma-70 factor [Butyricimonas paravirosa]
MTLKEDKNISSYQFCSGDNFEYLFNLYYSGLVVYANRFTKQLEISEDIVHDVFFTLWEKREQLHIESIKTYLFSSVRNRCLNHLEQLKVRNEYQEQILQKGDITGQITWELYVESELQEHIEQAILKLPPQCQRIFTMSRFDNKTVEEIAVELGISPRTVEKHLQVGLKKLRQELVDYLPAGLLLWFLFP